MGFSTLALFPLGAAVRRGGDLIGIGGFDHDSAARAGGIGNGQSTGAGLDTVLQRTLIGGINGTDRGHVGETRGPGQLVAKTIITGRGEETESGGPRIGGRLGECGQQRIAGLGSGEGLPGAGGSEDACRGGGRGCCRIGWRAVWRVF